MTRQNIIYCYLAAQQANIYIYTYMHYDQNCLCLFLYIYLLYLKECYMNLQIKCRDRRQFYLLVCDKRKQLLWRIFMHKKNVTIRTKTDKMYCIRVAQLQWDIFSVIRFAFCFVEKKKSSVIIWWVFRFVGININFHSVTVPSVAMVLSPNLKSKFPIKINIKSLSLTNETVPIAESVFFSLSFDLRKNDSFFFHLCVSWTSLKFICWLL